MPPRRNKEKFQQLLRSLNVGGLSVLEKEGFPVRYRSSCAAEQFHSDVNLKAADRQAPNNSKHCQYKTESDVRA
ncbi:transposable element Tcb1 transposase [Trichonephila clavipes]|nr:transposable element Tcb1 transposase [Trichonephila clavipes]